MNDTPVGCQNREWTEPKRDRWHGVAVTEEVDAERTRADDIRPYGFYPSRCEVYLPREGGGFLWRQPHTS